MKLENVLFRLKNIKNFQKRYVKLTLWQALETSYSIESREILGNRDNQLQHVIEQEKISAKRLNISKTKKLLLIHANRVMACKNLI